MKKRTKIILIIASHVLVLVIGFGGALWYVKDNLEKANAMMNSSSIISCYLMLAQAQCALGKDEDYRDSLLMFLKALDEARSPIDPLFDEKSYNTDKTMTLVRLSLVEKKIGNSQKSEGYMNKALESCKKIGWKECSEGKLIWFIERLDKNSVFGEQKKEEKK